jgi:hypothetical protein
LKDKELRKKVNMKGNGQWSLKVFNSYTNTTAFAFSAISDDTLCPQVFTLAACAYRSIDRPTVRMRAGCSNEIAYNLWINNV